MSDPSAIGRILKLISLISDREQLSTKDAAATLNLPVSTTHRLLRTLAEAEFAAQTDRGAFTPGMELHRIAGRLSPRMPLVRLAEPLLAALSSRFGETSMLTVLERRQLRMYFAASAAPPDPMRYVIELNRAAPLVWGASGRALLAFLRPDEIRRAIDTCEVTNVHGQPLDEAELREHLARIVTEGHAVSHSHRTLNSIGIAVPIFDAGREIVGSLAFQMPAFRLPERDLGDLIGALKDAVARISQTTGGGRSNGPPAQG